MVPEQTIGGLRSNLREHPAQRVRAAAAQLFTYREQNVFWIRPGKRQKVHVHPGRVQNADRHVQLHRGRVHKYHGRVPVRVPEHGGGHQLQHTPGQDQLHVDHGT